MRGSEGGFCPGPDGQVRALSTALAISSGWFGFSVSNIELAVIEQREFELPADSADGRDSPLSLADAAVSCSFPADQKHRVNNRAHRDRTAWLGM